MSEPAHPKPVRRLAAIVFTDVVGYSARMQREEAVTLALVKADFAQMRAQCVEHGGEVLNTMGDGMLICFPSALQAVTCSLQFQTGFRRRGETKPTVEALEHRISIHIGDIVLESDGVAGDGVNIAARVQTKAPPGGICVSQVVHDTVKNKLPMRVEFLGAQSFKNIEEKIPVYLLTPAGSSPGGSGQPAPPVHNRRLLIGATVVGLFLVAVTAVFRYDRPSASGAPLAPMATVQGKSVAVLPFANLSENKDNAFFTDGIHEDILTNLANVGALKVISRTSVIQYRDSKKPLRQIGDELGVAYVLEGSVQRTGDKVRVTGQLINARTDEHVWAKSYDRDLKDIFAIQSELAGEIAAALRTAISPLEKTRIDTQPTANLAAYELYLQGREIFRSTSSTREMAERAQPLLERAVKLDPRFAQAWSQLGLVYARIYQNLDQSEPQLARARDAMQRATQLAPDSILVLKAELGFYRYLGENVKMASVVTRIVERFPGRAETFAVQGVLASANSSRSEAIEYFHRALALDPRDEDTIRSLSGVLSSLRRYAEVDDCYRRLAEIRPLSLSQQYGRAMIPYLQYGDSGSMERLLSGLPEEMRRSDPGVISMRAQLLYITGDAAGLVQLWRDSGAKWRFSTTSARFDLLVVASAFLKLGKRDEAVPLLETNRGQLEAQLVNEPRNGARWCDLALTHTLLGEQPAARQALARTGDLLAAGQAGGVLKADLAVIHAWLGEKDVAFEILAERLRQPQGGPLGHVHQLQHSIDWWPLQGDPRLDALVNDPRNNAPLF